MNDLKKVRDALLKYSADEAECHARGMTHVPKTASEALSAFDRMIETTQVVKYNISGKDDHDATREDWKTIDELIAIARSRTFAPQGLPREPTEEMEYAGNNAVEKIAANVNGSKYIHDCDIALECWKAVLSAVPRPALTDVLLPWKCNCCHTKFQSAQQDRTDDGHGNGGAKCPRCKADGQYTYRDYSNPVDD